MRVLPLVALVVASPRQDVVPVHLIPVLRDGRPALALAIDSGVHVNARSVPVLELADGRLVRIGHGRLSADSAWFAEAPWAPRPSEGRVRGVLRVAYCRPEERFCRTAAVPVDLRGEPPGASGRR